MALKQTPAPYQRTKRSTLQIMIELTIALAIVWIASVVISFVKLGATYGVRAILLMVVAVAVTAVCDVLVTVLKNKKDKELLNKIPHDLIHSYSWVSAMIFVLCCPVWTSYYAIIMGSIFATVIGKHVFGGFGKNIFNPAAMGRIFVALCFDLSVPEALKNFTEVINEAGAGTGVFNVAPGLDATTGATVTNVINSSLGWLSDKSLTSFNTLDLLLGNYFGAMGETFTILLLVLGIALVIRKDMNWRAPAFYLGTVTVSALAIALVLGFRNPLTYVVYHLATGGVVFGAVFMITDPVTTPTSNYGNCLVGVLAGFMTVLIRVGTNAAEGVVYSLAIVNLVSPMVDGLIKGRTNGKLGVKYGVTFGSAALAVILTVGMAWAGNGGREVYEINGFTVEEYAEVETKLGINWVNDNGYKYGKAEAPEGITEAYKVLDGKNEVGVIYFMKTDTKSIVITTEPPYTTPVYGSVYVVFELSSKSIKEVKLTTGEKFTNGTGANNGAAYINFAQSYFDEASDIFADIADGSVGATYSAKGIQGIIKTAYEKFKAVYGA